jgi:biotin transport system substrate-specific component
MTSPVLRLYSQRVATIDALREERASLLVQVLAIAGFALLTALGAQFRIYIWEVPFSLQTLAVYGSGLFLGWRNGMLAQVLYLTIGLFMPVFAGDGYGFAYLFSAASAGYLFGYPLAAAVVGLMSRRWNSLTGSTLSMVMGSAVLFTTGVIWLHFAAGHSTWFESIDKGWLRFIPVDIAKIVMVSILYTGSRQLTERPE